MSVSLQTPHDTCTGCSACQQSCPTEAISMTMDGDGFIRPTVSADKCIHCGLCNKVCPVAEDKAERAPSNFISAYAAWNADLNELKLSSSGGIFSLLANRVLQSGGAVCGAVYDSLGHIYHTITETREGLSRMRGSKYVQSDMQDCFPRIRKLLQSGREVLFTGTGCQVGGLKSFLRKDYPNLLTMEIICEGTPSPGLWERHLHHVCPDMEKLHYLSFRDKAYGWTQILVAEYTDKKGAQHRIAIPAAKEPYIKAMFAAISQAPNCYACRFREGRSGADIIIGDMWALRVVAPEARPQCGASVILCNTERGAGIVEGLKPQMGYFKQISPLSAGINNGYVYRAPVIEQAARAKFYKNYREGKQIHEYLSSSLRDSNRVAILNHAGHNNYGSNLTAYALQETLRRMGYDACTVSLKPFQGTHRYVEGPFASFNSVLRWTAPVYGAHTCTKLNEHFDTFVVGSDQVWRYPQSWIRRCAEPAFYLDFAAQGKRRIAYAASFGISTYEGPDSLVRRFYRALRDFDAVSVREIHGLDILRDRFDYKDAVQVVDPVFLLSIRDWQRFSQAAEQPSVPGTLCTLFFFFENRVRSVITEYAQQHEMPLQSLTGNQPSVMTWLNRIENSALVVTDSFHTLCFAIIFERPFIVVSSESCGKSRLISLLKALGLEHRLIDMDATDDASLPSEFDRVASSPIDYTAVKQQMHVLISASQAWLMQAMKKTVTQKKNTIQSNKFVCMCEKIPFLCSKLRFKLRKFKQSVSRLLKKA